MAQQDSEGEKELLVLTFAQVSRGRNVGYEARRHTRHSDSDLKCICCSCRVPWEHQPKLQTLCHRTLIMSHEFTGCTCAYPVGVKAGPPEEDVENMDSCFCGATNQLCEAGQTVPCLLCFDTDCPGLGTSQICSSSNSLLFICCDSGGGIPVRRQLESWQDARDVCLRWFGMKHGTL